jgi:hypothetical protein
MTPKRRLVTRLLGLCHVAFDLNRLKFDAVLYSRRCFPVIGTNKDLAFEAIARLATFTPHPRRLWGQRQ